MKFIGFFASCLLSIHAAAAFGLLKHITPKPGGIIDTLTKPKLPGGHFQMGSHLSFGIGSFGFNLGFNKQYGAGAGVNLPKEPHGPGVIPGYPDGSPYVPGEKPGYPDGSPYVPGVKPEYPDGNPYVPGVKPEYPDIKPQIPGVTWEEEKKEKGPHYPRPNWGEDEKDYSKPGSHEEGKIDYPKHESHEDETDYPKRDSYENNKEDTRPDWEDIGEKIPDKDPKSENFMDGDLIADGLIQPRLNKNRSKRFIESRVYHVPLLFRSNAKPYKVKIQSNPNSLMHDGSEA